MTGEQFADLWALYPRKVAKKAAEKAYLKAVKTFPHASIVASLELMKSTEWRNREVNYIPYMASWLNREVFESVSKDPKFEERCELLVDEEEAKHKHYCNGYKEHAAHDWECDDALCMYPGHARCSKPVSAKEEKVFLL